MRFITNHNRTVEITKKLNINTIEQQWNNNNQNVRENLKKLKQ